MKNPYKGGSGDDNYKPLSFYEANMTGVENGFDSFSDDGEFYFTFNSGGTVYLISEGYSSESGRDNGINSVQNNMTIEARYQRMVHPNGKHYFNLRAGNNQNIATSRWFDSLGAMDTVISRMMGGQKIGGIRVAEGTELTAANRVANIAIAAPPPPATEDDKPKKKRKKRTGEKKPKKEKVYVANGNYLFNNITWDIFKSGNDRFYFTFKNPEGKTLFLNADVRGFETQAQAQAVVDQIMLFAPYESNYEGKPTKNGKYFFYILGEDGKKIGKSFFYGTTDDMQTAIGSLLGSEVERAAAAAAQGRDGSAAADKKTDDYLAPSDYDGAVGFHSFEQDGEYYFSYNDKNGKTLLRSEGYSSTAARDNGISSVTKNAPEDARWSTGRTPAGKYFYILKAGNHQEIGQSRHYDSEEAMLADFNWIKGSQSPIGAGSRIVDGVSWSAFSWKQKEDQAASAKAAAAAAATAAAAKAAADAKAKAEAEAAARRKAEEEAKAAAAKAKAEAEATARRKAEEEAKAKAEAEAAARRKAEEEAKAAAAAKAKAEAEATARRKAEEEAKAKAEAEAAARRKAEEEAKAAAAAKAKAEAEAAAQRKAEEEAKAKAAAKKKAEEEEAARLRAEIAAAKKKEEEEAQRLKAEIAAARQAEEAAAKKKAEQEAAEKVRLAAVAATAAAGASIAATSKADEPEDEEDDYLPCREYKGHNVNDKENNVALFKHENGQFYFALYDGNGNVQLRSEGFPSAKDRDQELSGVLKFKDDRSMYKRKKKGKYYMDILYDKTGREVGRSCLMKEAAPVVTKKVVKEEPKKVEVKKVEVKKEETSRSAALGAVGAGAVGMGAAASGKVTSKKVVVEKTIDEEDDYLPCREYQGHSVNDKVNNVALFKHDNGQFYFVLYGDNGKVRLRSEGFPSAQERDKELAGVLKFKDDRSMYKRKRKGKYYMDVLYDRSGREVGRSCLEKEEEVKKTTAAPAAAAATVAAAAAATPIIKKKIVVERTIDEEDDYLPCKEYEGHKVTDKKNSLALFKHKNGQFYFVVYGDKGKVRLRSEGFKTTAERDDELKEVIRFLGDKSMYKRKRKGNFYMDVLYDKTGREIGRSCLEKDAPKSVAKPVAAAAVTAAAATAVVTKKKVSTDKEDDYLICREYKGKKVTDKKNNVALFKHDNGKFYFAVYDNKGNVRLRSEGFETSGKRESELRGVLKNIKNKDRYKRVKRGNVYYDVLHDNKGREVGRSCLKKEEPVPVAAAAPVAKKAVATKAVATKAAAATTAATTSSSSAFPWWWILLPLLLLALFFLWRSCENTKAVVPPPPPVEANAEPVRKEVAPPPPPAPTCACNGMDGNVFSIPSAAQPKVLTRLGTNPEFGYVRDLGKEAFLAKLAGRHKVSSRDRQFLDGVFNSLGYTNGFSDVTADNIESVRITPGTVGNIGAGKNHRTVYAKLDISGRDVEAFRIEGPNACAIHFMKTCGNHFYYCE